MNLSSWPAKDGLKTGDGSFPGGFESTPSGSAALQKIYDAPCASGRASESAADDRHVFLWTEQAHPAPILLERLR